MWPFKGGKLIDNYPETGDLKITKTFGGDVTAEELAKGAIQFTVAKMDGETVLGWLDKDGKFVENKDGATAPVIKLGADDKFEKGADGVWSKTFAGVELGTYKVTETNYELGGFTMGSTTKAEDSATVTAKTVGEKAATAALKDVYEKTPDYTPALEKYINKDVHSDLPAFDTTFTYDILAFVPADADKVVIKDALDDKSGISFISKATEVVIQDIGPDNDHTAHGTVEKAEGTDIEQSEAAIDGKELTVTIKDATANRGHWVRVTYVVKLDNSKIADMKDYDDDTTDVSNNKTVISKEYPTHEDGTTSHDGVASTASYTVYVNDDDGNAVKKYGLQANTITVTPPTTDVDIKKVWVKDGKACDWPEGATATFEILGDGETLGEITLKAGNESGAFEGIPVYENVEYKVVEKSVKGIDSDSFTTSVEGDAETGFTVTNAITEDTNGGGGDNDNPSGGNSETIDITINKYLTGTQTYVAGATLQLVDKATGDLIDEWTTAKVGYKIADVETGKVYILKETKAPSGYELATDVEFELVAGDTPYVKINSGAKLSDGSRNARAAGEGLDLYDAKTPEKGDGDKGGPKDGTTDKDKDKGKDNKKPTTPANKTTHTTTTNRTSTSSSTPARTGDQNSATLVALLSALALASVGVFEAARRRRDDAA